MELITEPFSEVVCKENLLDLSMESPKMNIFQNLVKIWWTVVCIMQILSCGLAWSTSSIPYGCVFSRNRLSKMAWQELLWGLEESQQDLILERTIAPGSKWNNWHRNQFVCFSTMMQGLGILSLFCIWQKDKFQPSQALKLRKCMFLGHFWINHGQHCGEP